VNLERRGERTVTSAVGRRPECRFGRDEEVRRLAQLLAAAPLVQIVGLPGIGKSSLAATAGIDRTVVAQVCSPDLEHVVAFAAARLGSLATLDAVLGRFEAAGAVWLLEDAHVLPAAAREELAAHAATMHDGRVLVTASERVFDDPRLAVGELHLRGLDEPGARDLWSWLDDLDRPAPGFAAAFVRTGGHPLLLRRAHAGDLVPAHPIAALVASLAPDELVAARTLAVSPVALPRAALEDGNGVASALPRLRRRLLIDGDGAGVVTLEPAARAPLLAQAPAGALRAVREALVARLEAGGLARSAPLAPLALRALAAQLAALGRAQALAAHLEAALEAGALSDMSDDGRGELVAQLVAEVPASHRSPALRVARARGLGGRDQARAAIAGLTGVAGAEATLARAHLLRRAGLLVQAEAEARAALVADEVADGSEPAAAIAMQARAELALQAALAGRAHDDGNLPPPLAELCQAFAALCADRRDPSPLMMMSAVDPAWRCLVAGLPAVLVGGDSAVRRAGDAVLALGRGDRCVALADLAAAERQLVLQGDVIAALWARIWQGRALHLLGRSREARGLLVRCADEARAGGAEALVALADASDAWGLAAQLVRPEPPAWLPRARLDALAALRHALAGEVLEAEILADRSVALARDDYAVERVLGHVAHACLARVHPVGSGPSATVEDELAAAARTARLGDVDVDLLMLARSLTNGLVAVAAGGSRIVRAGAPLEAQLVIDATVHAIRGAGGVVSLRRRTILRRLLYALARRPGSVVSRDELTMALWGRTYCPRVHDNPLKVNVANLKKVVGGLGLRVRAEQPGYVLEVPSGFVFLEP
jgi:hypothetical protein